MMKTLKPNCIILGAAKSGTTYLLNLLKQHSEICTSKSKEPAFFTNDKKFSNVENYFKFEYSHYKGEKIILDNTPIYLLKSFCAKNIFDFSGSETKLVCILRNPTDRAFSHHTMLTIQTLSDQPFEQVIHDEINGTGKGRPTYRPFKRVKSDILHRGLYYESLMNFTKYFDKNNIHIIIFEKFIKAPESELQDLLRFLNIDADYQFDFNVRQNTRMLVEPTFFTRITAVAIQFMKRIGFKFKKPTYYKIIGLSSRIISKKKVMNDDTRKFLINYYLNSIENLEKEFNLDLSIWKK